MSDPLLDTADAIVAALTPEALGDGAPTFTVARSLLPIVEIGQGPDSQVLIKVVPVDDEAAKAASGLLKADLLVRVFVQMKLPPFVDTPSDEAAAGSLMSFCGDIRSFFLLNPLTVEMRNVWCFKADRKPACDMGMLGEKREFFGMIEAHWRMW